MKIKKYEPNLEDKTSFLKTKRTLDKGICLLYVYGNKYIGLIDYWNGIIYINSNLYYNPFLKEHFNNFINKYIYNNWLKFPHRQNENEKLKLYTEHDTYLNKLLKRAIKSADKVNLEY